MIATALSGSLPAVVPEGAPPTVFSAARALATIRALTASGLPHPIGSADHERAREVVVQAMRALGLTPSLQQARACREDGRCADVVNVLARIQGSEPGAALLLASHYDSVAAGPGASDDGAGTSAVLEIARALLAGPRPRRDVILLVDDGEEAGLFGARAFVNEHPWARDVGVVLNFEARGTQGQTSMFETSEQSVDLLDLYARVADRPVASSMIYALYKQLPSDTDLTVFKKAGMRGLNFAFADGVWNYHTRNDDVAHLDPRSLQHMGDQGLASARALADDAPSREGTAGAVWFDLLTWKLVVYRTRWVVPLALLAAAIGAAAIGQAGRRRLISLRATAAGAALALALPLAATLAGIVTAALIGELWRPLSPLDPAPLVPWALLVAAGALGALALAAALRRLCMLDRWSGAVLFWNQLSLGLAFVSPGSSYLFTLPALALGLGLLAAPRAEARAASIALVPVAVTALLWFPIARVILVMVGAGVSPAITLPIGLFATTAAALFGADKPPSRIDRPGPG